MNILVSGIQGYIGSRMGAILTTRGHVVTGIDTGFFEDGLLYKPQDVSKIIRTDIRKVTPLMLEGYDAVVHLADLSNDPLGTINEQTTREINYKGAVHFAKTAKEAGVSRYVYSSSCSVYGVATEDLVNEQSVLNPQTAYARCKRDVEQAVSQIADALFSPVFLRNATVFGPSPRMRFDLVVNNLVGHAIINKEIRLTSDGTPWRPLVHIEDVCTAFACALEAPREAIHNQVFNVGATDGNYQIKDVANIIGEVFPECEVSFGSSDGDTRSYRVSFDKIANTLPGFSCKHNVRSGVVELKALFEKIGLTKDQFEGKEHIRLKQIQYLLTEKKIDNQFFWTNA